MRLIVTLFFFTINFSYAAPTEILTTTNILADTLSNISTSTVKISSLMSPGVDPHQYRPSPTDMRKMLGSELVITNGLHLEGKLLEAIEGVGKRVPVLTFADSIEKSRLRFMGNSENTVDPHIWFDVSLWNDALKGFLEKLKVKYPDMTIHQEAYLDELQMLDSWISAQIQSIPKEKRVLVTAHDAFEYFGARYGIEVLSIQGINTATEVSLRDLEKLVSVIVTRKIPAVFFESSVPKRSVEALIQGAAAQGHTVRLGGELYSDSLGAPGSGADTYVTMVKKNVETIVGALK